MLGLPPREVAAVEAPLCLAERRERGVAVGPCLASVGFPFPFPLGGFFRRHGLRGVAWCLWWCLCCVPLVGLPASSLCNAFLL